MRIKEFEAFPPRQGEKEGKKFISRWVVKEIDVIN
jgi:hypothetical protein